MTHGGKLPEIAKFLTESTGRVFQHRDVYNVIQKLQKRFQGTGEDLQQVPPQGLQPQEGFAPPSSIVPGLLFPNFNSMRASLDEWSRLNFSPITLMRSQGVRPGHSHPLHMFGCPHKRHKKANRILGTLRKRKNIVEFVDCPFRINTKVNADGSCVVTKAVTEHSGHPVSEEQYQKYKR